MKEAFTVRANEPGETGSLSPGKIIAWFWTLVAMYISLHYFGLVPGPLTDMTFWEWIMSSFVFGVMAAGFYWGMAKGAFETVAKAIGDRIRGK